eukprot:g16363.t1
MWSIRPAQCHPRSWHPETSHPHWPSENSVTHPSEPHHMVEGHAQPIHGAVVHGDVGDGGDGHEQRSHMANTEDQQGEARAEPEEKELAAPPARHAAQEDLQECHSLSEHMPSLAETDVVLGPDISHMAHYSARCMSRLDRFCPVLNLFNADQEGIVEKYHGLADWHKSLTFGPILPDRIEPLLLCEAPDDLPAPAPAPSSAEAVEVPAEEPVAEPVLQVEGPPEELPGDGEALARPEPERALVIQLPGSSNHLHESYPTGAMLGGELSGTTTSTSPPRGWNKGKCMMNCGS